MFKLFKRKPSKDPICGMVDNGRFISKHGEKFCSENCVKEYEKKNQIAGDEREKGHQSDCGCH